MLHLVNITLLKKGTQFLSVELQGAVEVTALHGAVEAGAGSVGFTC